MGKVAHVSVEPNGSTRVTRNGQMLVLHPPRTKDVADMNEVMTLRHFLERSETTAPEAKSDDGPWLLVIDHRQARIFRSEMQGTTPHQLLPHEPADYFRHGPNSMEVSRGKEKPDPNSFFEPVAKALQAAGQILIFGTGTGMSSEMDQFIAWTKSHYPELAKRIIGSVAVDEHHLSEDQLLAKAREFYAGVGTS